MVDGDVASSQGIPVPGMRDPAATRVWGCNHKHDPFAAAADIGGRGTRVHSNRGCFTVKRERRFPASGARPAPEQVRANARVSGPGTRLTSPRLTRTASSTVFSPSILYGRPRLASREWRQLPSAAQNQVALDEKEDGGRHTGLARRRPVPETRTNERCIRSWSRRVAPVPTTAMPADRSPRRPSTGLALQERHERAVVVESPRTTGTAQRR